MGEKRHHQAAGERKVVPGKAGRTPTSPDLPTRGSLKCQPQRHCLNTADPMSTLPLHRDKGPIKWQGVHDATALQALPMEPLGKLKSHRKGDEGTGMSLRSG